MFNMDYGNSDLLKSKSKFLAHYTSRDKAIGGLLATRSLRFNTRENVNDPRESRLRGSSASWCGTLGEEHISALMVEVRDAVRYRLQVCCFREQEITGTGIVRESLKQYLTNGVRS